MLCSGCAADLHLSERIEQTGNPEICSVCEQEKPRTFSSEEIGELLAQLLRDRLVIVDGATRTGDTLEYLVGDILGQDLPFVDEIVDAIVGTEYAGNHEIGDGFWSETNYYERATLRPPSYLTTWRATQEHLKHSRRFFSDTAKRMFDELFRDIERMSMPTFFSYRSNFSKKRSPPRVVIDLPKDYELYRSRICETADDVATWDEDPYLHVGPPPEEKARAGRMNAEGVVVLYCAGDEKTSLAEMRPGRASRQAVIALKTTRQLRMLDFHRLAQAEIHSPISDFHPQYFNELSKRAFLKRVHRLISRPIAVGREFDYLITQTMAEYLSHVFQPRFDGIIFSSAQRVDGKNFVIFKNPDDDLLIVPDVFPVEYVAGSLKYFETTAVTYDHNELTIHRPSTGKAYLDDLEPEDDDPDD
jgi:hypothetical protein